MASVGTGSFAASAASSPKRADLPDACCTTPDEIVAAGDHLNDLPMLSSEFARWLVAPVNAIDKVKEAVLRQNGYVSEKHCGSGVAHGISQVLKAAGFALETLADKIAHQPR